MVENLLFPGRLYPTPASSTSFTFRVTSPIQLDYPASFLYLDLGLCPTTSSHPPIDQCQSAAQSVSYFANIYLAGIGTRYPGRTKVPTNRASLEAIELAQH